MNNHRTLSIDTSLQFCLLVCTKPNGGYRLFANQCELQFVQKNEKSQIVTNLLQYTTHKFDQILNL